MKNEWLIDTLSKHLGESKQISLLVPFNYKLVEGHFRLFILLVASIIGNEDELETDLIEMANTTNDPDREHIRLLNLVNKARTELKQVCNQYIIPLIKERYLIVDAKPMGNNLILILDNVEVFPVDYSVENYILQYL